MQTKKENALFTKKCSHKGFSFGAIFFVERRSHVHTIEYFVYKE